MQTIEKEEFQAMIAMGAIRTNQGTNFSDYLQQGKSNRYLAAESEGKLKAGEAAKYLSKKFKLKVTAKEIEELATEWHHAGVFKGFSGKLTGRKVYFFTNPAG